MRLGDVKKVLKSLIKNNTGVTPMLWGRHGIGKSAIVTALGDEIGYRTQTIILSQRDAVDLNGMLYIHEHPTLGSVTSNHPPDWFADALQNGKLILFLDEYNLSRREVINASAELINDRRLNGKKLPDSVFIVCAGNPPDDERYDVSSMSSMTLDRMMHIHVEPDIDATLAYARESGVDGKSRWNADAINYLALNPKAFYKPNENDSKFPIEIDFSPRSWERAQKMFSLSDLSIELRRECMRGLIGAEHATSFINYLSTSEDKRPLVASQVFGDKETAKKAMKLYESWTSSGKNSDIPFDIVNISADNMVAYVVGMFSGGKGDAASAAAARAEEKKFVAEHGDTIVEMLKNSPKAVSKRIIHDLHKIDSISERIIGEPFLKDLVAANDAAHASMTESGIAGRRSKKTAKDK